MNTDIRVIDISTFQKWWLRRAGQCAARATSISAWIREERATTQCPARRARTGPGRLLASLSGFRDPLGILPAPAASPKTTPTPAISEIIYRNHSNRPILQPCKTPGLNSQRRERSRPISITTKGTKHTKVQRVHSSRPSCSSW